MNKAEVIAQVSEMSGVDAESCEKVLKALQKVLQKELGTSSGGFAAMKKIKAMLTYLHSDL